MADDANLNINISVGDAEAEIKRLSRAIDDLVKSDLSLSDSMAETAKLERQIADIRAKVAEAANGESISIKNVTKSIEDSKDAMKKAEEAAKSWAKSMNIDDKAIEQGKKNVAVIEQETAALKELSDAAKSTEISIPLKTAGNAKAAASQTNTVEQSWITGLPDKQGQGPLMSRMDGVSEQEKLNALLNVEEKIEGRINNKQLEHNRVLAEELRLRQKSANALTKMQDSKAKPAETFTAAIESISASDSLKDVSKKKASIAQDISKDSSKLNSVRSQIKSIQKSMQGAGKSVDALDDKFKLLFKTLDKLAPTLKEISPALKEMAASTKVMNRALDKQASNIKKTEHENKKFAKSVNDVSKAEQKMGMHADKATKSVRQLIKEQNKMAKSTAGGVSFLTMLGKIKAAYFVIKGIGQAIWKPIMASADAAEATNKFDQVFSTIAVSAEAAASRFAVAFGLSITSARDMLSQAGSLLSGIGFGDKESLKISLDLSKMAGDWASFANVSAERAANAFTKALLGEKEALKGLGIAILDKDLRERAEQEGLIYKELTRQQKAYLTMEVLAQRTAKATGDRARTANSLANVMKDLGESSKTFSINIGDALRKMLNIDSIAKKLKWALDYINNSIKKGNDEAAARKRLKDIRAGIKLDKDSIDNNVFGSLIEAKRDVNVNGISANKVEAEGMATNLGKAVYQTGINFYEWITWDNKHRKVYDSNNLKGLPLPKGIEKLFNAGYDQDMAQRVADYIVASAGDKPNLYNAPETTELHYNEIVALLKRKDADDRAAAKKKDKATVVQIPVTLRDMMDNVGNMFGDLNAMSKSLTGLGFSKDGVANWLTGQAKSFEKTPDKYKQTKKYDTTVTQAIEQGTVAAQAFENTQQTDDKLIKESTKQTALARKMVDILTTIRNTGMVTDTPSQFFDIIKL